MSVVAIGFFDGVHLGHQRILEDADIAVTFRNHPLTVLNAAKAPRLIMSYEDRIAAIRACGVKDVVALDFTSVLASQSPEDFFSFLRLRLPTPASSLRCGANWRFGRNGEGNPDWLRGHGIDVQVVDDAVYEGAVVSSTRIRECLSRGEIAAANAMMGRRFRVTGSVVSGKGEGRKLGYPTVNLSLRGTSQSTIDSALPLGVYQVAVAGRRAIANYGLAPTFGGRAWKAPVLEVHLLAGNVVFPDSEVDVEFVRYIRPEKRFPSLAGLQAQIAADIASLM